jgi:hypothetical protein
MVECLLEHEHQSEEERDACDAQTHDATSLVKMSRVNFAAPARIGRLYVPGRVEMRGSLEVVVFSQDQIVPWELEEKELPETD